MEMNLTPPERSAQTETLKVDEFRHIVWSGLLVIAVFFGGFGGWAVLAKLSSAVVANGSVKVDLNRKTVQHREGGIVQEILVREGDKVQEGQALVILSDSQVDSTVAVLGNQLAQMLARVARLDAHRQLKTAIVWPQELLDMEKTPEVRQAMEGEENILREERMALEGQIRLLHQQILGMQAQVQAEERIISAFQEELAAKMELQRNRYLEKTPVLDLQRNLATHQSIRSVTLQKIAETNMRISEMRKEYVQRGTMLHADAQSKLVEVRERIRPTQDAQKRLAVSASVAGTVMDMTVFTKGAVVRPGERIMDIVPEGGVLIVEGDIHAQDIAKVYVGQDAKIQISAFNQNEVAPLMGTITYVSPDRSTPRGIPGELPVYKVHAAISQEELAANNVSLTAGMPAVVFILTKEKTVLGYLMEPITQRLRQALRE